MPPDNRGEFLIESVAAGRTSSDDPNPEIVRIIERAPPGLTQDRLRHTVQIKSRTWVKLKESVYGMSTQIAIIGAGIAGLAAAERLRQSGAGIALFEKSRGVGGRMATRRVIDMEFDHGTQYFTADGDRFCAMAEQWRADGHADEWFDGASSACLA